MSSIDIIAVITPAQGKAERVVELLKEVAVFVKSNEPDVLRYHINLETKKNGDQEVVILETYKNKAALASHGNTAEFKAFQKKLADESLIAGPLQLRFIKPVGGFEARL